VARTASTHPPCVRLPPSPASLRVRGTRPLFAEPGKRPPPYHGGSAPLPCAPIGNWSQPTATVFACPSRLQGRPGCHRLRPLCSINAPSSVVPKGNTEQDASGLGSICYAVAVPVRLRRAVGSGSVRRVISRGGRGHPRCSQSVA